MRRRASLFIVASMFGALGAPAARASETQAAGAARERWIEVTGEGSVDVKPDFARVTLGVTTTGKDASEAVAANAKAVNALIGLLKSDGIAPADVQTSSLSITPQFSNPRQGSASEPAIVGYSVSNMVTVTERDIPKLGALIDKSVGAGANAMYSVGYGENDPSALLDKARPLAFADARRKADLYAAAAGARLGPLLRLAEQGGAQPIPMAGRLYAKAAAAAPTPIEPGEDRLNVSVTARFELKD